MTTSINVLLDKPTSNAKRSERSNAPVIAEGSAYVQIMSFSPPDRKLLSLEKILVSNPLPVFLPQSDLLRFSTRTVVSQILGLE